MTGTRLRYAFVATACALAMGVAACGDDEEESSGGGGAETSEETREVKVGLAMIGPRNDRAFAQQHYEGTQRAADEIPGVELTAVLENRESPQSQADAIRTLATSGNDVVITASATFAPLIDELASRYPDVKFIQTSGLPKKQQENVTGVVHDQGQPAFAAGQVMATLSKSDTIGYVGALEIPPDIAAENGIEAGAQEVNPDIRLLTNRVGNFNDAAKAKDIASAEIEQGADQLAGFVDAGIPGVYQAAEESGKSDVGVVNITTNGCEGQNYDSVIGTMTPKYDNIIFDAIQAEVDGTLEPGGIVLGVENTDYIDLELCEKYSSMEEVKQARDSAIEGLASGELELPKNAQVPEPGYELRRGFE